MFDRSYLALLLLSALPALVGCGTSDGGGPDGGGSGGGSGGTVGLLCTHHAECGPEGRCLLGFVELATPFVGLTMPAGYCTASAACTSDGDCSGGSRCFRPLADATPADVAALPFDGTDLVDQGICLQTCEAPSECRTAEGFTCAMPLADELAEVPGVREDTYCVPVVEKPCAPDPARNTSGTCTLTYALEGQFEITGAPVAAANGTREVGPGTLVVRVSSADGVAASDGPASILCYDMHQRFSLAGVVTVTQASAAASEALNTGTLEGDTLTWDSCEYAESHCQSVSSWTPADAASGPGCMANYHSRGDVLCTLDAFCSVGGLEAGHNRQDDTWAQPFNSLVFAEGFTTVTMGGLGGPDACEGGPERVEVPNANPTRTWLSFTGTLIDTTCTP